MTEIDFSSEQFELRLSGKGVTIERNIDHLVAAEIMNLVLGVRPAGTIERREKEVAAASEVRLSLREYLDAVKATRKPDQIVAIGHYISLHEAQATFSRDDVRSRFAVAKEPMPGNFPRDFALAIKAGMIAEAHQRAGYFYVTKTGIQAVERLFAAEKK